MKRLLNRNRFRNFLAENYYWMVILGYLIALEGNGFSVVILSGLLLIILFLLNFSKWVKIDFVSIYFIYLIVSLVMYIENERPISLYITSVAYILLPIVMYMIPKENGSMVMRRAMNAVFFSLLVAVVLYIWAPEFYAEYLYSRSLIGKPDVLWIRPSLIQGLYGITTIGTFGTCCALYFFAQIVEKKRYSAVKFIICVLIVLFAQRRSAIAALGVGLILENIILCRHGKIKKRFLAIAIFTGIALFVLLSFHSSFSSLVIRVISVREAVLERAGNWRENINGLGVEMIWGKGLGSYGHLAGAIGYKGVFDSQYVLMLVENGIIGILLFFLSVCMAFRRFSGRYCESCVPMLIVVVFLIQCIGSNVLEMPLPATLFWFSLSYMQKSSALKQRRIEIG